MSRIPPLYVCPDCEGGVYMYAGKVIAKVCSECADRRQNAATGSDRRDLRKMFSGINPRVRKFFQ